MNREFIFRKAACVASLVLAVMFSACSPEEEIKPDGDEATKPNIENAIKLDKLLEAVYRTGDASGNGNYEFVISNTTSLGWEGDMEVVVSLYNALDEDPLNAVVPSGTYEASANKEVFTYDTSSTLFTIVRNGEYFYSPLLGTVSVYREGPTYTILVEGMLVADQSEISVAYTGNILFVEGVTAAWTKFSTAQEFTLTQSSGRYWGGWFYPFADDMALDLYSGEFNEEGEQVEGYHIQLSNLYISKLADYNAETVEVPAGVYKMANDNPMYINSYAQAFTFDKGYLMDFYGTMLNVGTYVTYVNQEQNVSQIGYIVDGTITVSGSGSNYTLEFNLVTEEDVTITATYTGALNLENFNDNDSQPVWNSRPWTSLTEDHTLDWKPETVGYGLLFGDYIVEGLDTWLVMIMAENSSGENYGDYFTTELLVPATNDQEVAFPTGTFNITWELGADVMIPGYKDASENVLFSYYGDLTTDAEGYSSAVAALDKGTVVITRDEESGEYKFVFNVEDVSGNKITGEWQGEMIVEDYRGSVSEDEGDHDHDHDHDHSHAPQLLPRANR